MSQRKKPGQICAIAEKYKSFNWTVIITPPNTMNDLIAQRDRRLHFVRIVPNELAKEPDFTGLARNTFIQNAFSNGAEPIFAYVNDSQKTVAFEDVNIGARVIIGRAQREPKSIDHTT